MRTKVERGRRGLAVCGNRFQYGRVLEKRAFLPNHMSHSGYHEMRTHCRESVVPLSPCYQDAVQEKMRNRYVCFIFSKIMRQK